MFGGVASSSGISDEYLNPTVPIEEHQAPTKGKSKKRRSSTPVPPAESTPVSTPPQRKTKYPVS